MAQVQARECGCFDMIERDELSSFYRISECKFADEDEFVSQLLKMNSLGDTARQAIETAAVELVKQVRDRRGEHSLLDTFLQEFGLSNDEGVALLCLAEALLRIPDSDTVDALIADKIVPSNWVEHLGESDSTFVNASTWGLMLTGKVIAVRDDRSAADWLMHLTRRLGEPVVRIAMRQAMSLLGREFVLGETISEALDRSRRNDYAMVSFDMLGEGARTLADAERYLALYASAVNALPVHSGNVLDAANGISIKLSALHPRYQATKRNRFFAELYPRLSHLAELAFSRNVQLAIDAEEASRCELSLELFARLCRESALRGWNGPGLVVQAYSKRSLSIIDWLADLAQQTDRRIPVRLVKGAYWDAEIKAAQVAGHPDFPVFTRKENTDLCYLVCAQRLFSCDRLFPQFATHNAHTIASIMELAADRAGERRAFEFQRLHGMGELLYRRSVQHYEHFPPQRVYAPVGSHEDLLPYLVRRLLENGANSSFVNRFLDEKVPAREVVKDPVAVCLGSSVHRSERIPTPERLLQPVRVNSAGRDFADYRALDALSAEISEWRWTETSVARTVSASNRLHSVRNPANQHETVGQIALSRPEDVQSAFASARRAFPEWNRRGAAGRAAILESVAEELEHASGELTALLVKEAGKTLTDADAEVREAVDFCRYYAAESRRLFRPMHLPGPTGEDNQLLLKGRGVFVCISPWNFPLAIFTGQIAGALAAGNCVIAKPAEQTPLIAELAVRLWKLAGLGDGCLSLLTGGGELGAQLVSHASCAGVAFTGSTATAHAIQLKLANRPGPIIPLIAETGGQNAMIVDSSALLEQVTDDVIVSAFSSAGQRCSALRVLCLQQDIADRALTMILGAMRELRVADPVEVDADIGPLIDDAALQALRSHVERMKQQGHPVHEVTDNLPADGYFMAPTLIELDSIGELDAEHFGPILHVVRFPSEELLQIVNEINDTDYALTLGIHSRIDGHRRLILEHAAAGNVYVNRNMIGAQVGVQPFGGQALSGTGPKAGGPHYLLQFATEQTVTINTTAQGGDVELLRD
jgi:RHH-type proline utilization regulon transcriptional repressor/proline dehydrogenase/delta 1-pyrroline-5-carboxylate dehydrogenase